VAELDDGAELSQNGTAHKDLDRSPNDENEMTQNARKSNFSFVVGDKNEELEEVVQDEGKMEVEDDQSSDSKNDDRFGDDDNLSSDEGGDAESSTSGETHPNDCTIDDDDDTTTDHDDECIEQPPKSKRKSTSDILFTTGLGFTSENQLDLMPVIKSAADKNEFSLSFNPDKNLYCLVFWWARKPPFHFAADTMNSNAAVAREAGLSSPFQICRLCGWILTRRSATSGHFNLQYKRFHECLTNAKFPHDHKALNINGMIQKVYQDLDTCVLPSNCPPVSPGTAKCNPSKTKTAIMAAAKKQKTSTASKNFELIHAHDPGSFLQRLTLNTKCLQIALF
jgi:hypothetical protein